MKKFAAPLIALTATSVSLGAAAQAMTDPQGFAVLLHLNPDPSVAWIMAFGFLGLVVLRRTRSGPMN